MNAALPRLLLVDDDRLVLATLARGMAAQGWQVSCADSAEDARAQLAAGLRPDIALLDVRLPGDDGVTLARELGQRYQLPCLMLSAWGDEATVASASDSGALGYLVKPLDPLQLGPMLRTALARAREQANLRQNNEQLEQALQQTREINVAVGILMVQHRLKRDAAFELLRKAARCQRRRLATLAQEVIQGSELLHAPSARALADS
ncbi:ANTAR domain-containing response regulator [Comamonas flocculans]|uniref:Response regulator n=1 Tax=Comamonas flocculans TaxID=2597701 RepID=A0A5B8RVE9_9BURK|nr:response regulator [Comamonas flocculans]QEA13093.1 response regulator [Comamonas flocculans]